MHYETVARMNGCKHESNTTVHRAHTHTLTHKRIVFALLAVRCGMSVHGDSVYVRFFFDVAYHVDRS